MDSFGSPLYASHPRVAVAQPHADAAVRVVACVRFNPDRESDSTFFFFFYRSPEGLLNPCGVAMDAKMGEKKPLGFSSDKYEVTAIILAEQIGPYGALLSMQGGAVLSEPRQEDG